MCDYYCSRLNRSVGLPAVTLHRSASAVSVAVQALQKAKLKIREQVPIFNYRLLHLRCATAVALGLIAAFPVEHYLPKRIRRTLISAGDTPGMREACAMVLGRIFSNFWRASMVNDCIVV